MPEARVATMPPIRGVGAGVDREEQALVAQMLVEFLARGLTGPSSPTSFELSWTTGGKRAARSRRQRGKSAGQ